MKATDLFVQCLENEGVEYIFGIVGKEVIDLADSLSKSEKIKYIPVRHEQGAAFMADLYGRITGKPGVCLATLGPGATNLLTGIASAFLDHSPVVAITGQKGQEAMHLSAHQFLNIAKIYEPATKWSVQIKDANTIPEIIRQSFRLAAAEKPGPILIEFPENLAAENATAKPMPPTNLPAAVPSAASISLAAHIINNSSKPFVVIGNGAIRQNAAPEVQKLLQKLACPVATSFMAKGILPKGHTQNYYTFGFNEKDYALRGIEEADLLIVIGFDFVEKLPGEWNRKKVPVLHIDTLPAEVDQGYPVKSELIGNLKHTLQELIAQNLQAKPWKPEGDLQERIEEAFLINQKLNKNSRFRIENVLHILEDNLTDDMLIISDVGSHKVSIARTFQPRHPRQLIISNGLASMGISIPGAIGAKLGAPERKVVCITGDGGALMNIAELETAKRLGLAFVIILLKDSMLKIEVEMMNQKFGENYGAYFSNPDFVKMAEAFGIIGIKAANEEFGKALQIAITSNEIVLIETDM